MTRETVNSFLETRCKGKSKAIAAATLCAALNVSDSELRRSVNQLRREGVPIGSSLKGYFYCENAGEVYATIRSLKKMCSGIEKAVVDLECALGEFR